MTRAVMAVVVFSASAALPCSGPTCDSYFSVVPRPGSVFPANAPAIGLNRTLYSESSWDGGSTPLVSTWELTIRKVDGGAVGWSDGGTSAEPWAVLDGPLVEGDQLWIEANGPGLTACAQQGVLTLGPSAPFPLTPAVISLANFEVLENTGGVCGGPTGLVEHAQLTATPTAEMTPWLPLTRWELEVDGTNYAASNFGGLTASTQTGSPAPSGLHPVLTLHAQCDSSGSPSNDARLSAGPHQVRLLARVVGIPTALASNTITVDFQCATQVSDAGMTNAPPPSNGRGCSSIDELGVIALLGALLRRPRKQAVERA